MASFPTFGYDEFANGYICADNLVNLFVTPDGKLPPGMGFKIGPGTNVSYIVTCGHFHAHDLTGSHNNSDGAAKLSQTSHVVVQFDTLSGEDARDIKPAAFLILSRYKTGIIAAESETVIPASFTIDEAINITVVGVLMHTHSLATNAKLLVVRSNGQHDPILETDIRMPAQYQLLEKPARISQNDTIVLLCTFVNPSSTDVAIG